MQQLTLLSLFSDPEPVEASTSVAINEPIKSHAGFRLVWQEPDNHGFERSQYFQSISSLLETFSQLLEAGSHPISVFLGKDYLWSERSGVDLDQAISNYKIELGRSLHAV